MTTHAEDALACSCISQILDLLFAITAFETVCAECLIPCQDCQIFNLVATCLIRGISDGYTWSRNAWVPMSIHCMRTCNLYTSSFHLQAAMEQQLISSDGSLQFDVVWRALTRRFASESISMLQVLQRKQSMCHRSPAKLSSDPF